MIIILNNVQSSLKVENDLEHKALRSLREYMGVQVPGYYWVQQSGSKWNGITYYITPKGLFSTGFLPLIVKYLQEEFPEIDLQVEDIRGDIPKFELTDLNVGKNTMDGKYDHQARVASKINNYIDIQGVQVYFPRGIIDVATNGGKTTIAAGIFKNLKGDNRLLFTIDRKAIFNQLAKELTEAFGEIGLINDKNYNIKPITLAMVQTLHNRMESINVLKDLHSFNVLVSDESHKAGSKTHVSLFKNCPAPVRVFLSGTALDSGNPISKMNIIGLSGMRLDRITKRELMDKGISTEAEVHIHLCNTILRNPVFDYSEIQRECIYRSSERASIIWHHSKDDKYQTLIAVDKIEHGQEIYNQLINMRDYEKPGMSIEFTHGQDREQAGKIEDFQKGIIKILISTEILQAGVNLPLVNNVWNAGGGKSTIKVKQWMGRAERLSENKDKFLFHDFYDIGKHIRKHSEARLKIYRDEGLSIVEHYDPKHVKILKPVLIR